MGLDKKNPAVISVRFDLPPWMALMVAFTSLGFGAGVAMSVYSERAIGYELAILCFFFHMSVLAVCLTLLVDAAGHSFCCCRGKRK